MRHNLYPGRVASALLAATLGLAACSTVSEVRHYEGPPIAVGAAEDLYQDAGGDLRCGSTNASTATVMPTNVAEVSNVSSTGNAYEIPRSELPMDADACADRATVWVIEDGVPNLGD